jgi:hypothetical protein
MELHGFNDVKFCDEYNVEMIVKSWLPSPRLGFPPTHSFRTINNPDTQEDNQHKSNHFNACLRQAGFKYTSKTISLHKFPLIEYTNK